MSIPKLLTLFFASEILSGCFLPGHEDPLLDTYQRGFSFEYLFNDTEEATNFYDVYVKAYDRHGKAVRLFRGAEERDTVRCKNIIPNRISCVFDMERGSDLTLKVFSHTPIGTLSYQAIQDGFNYTTPIRLHPHKVNSGLSLSDILNYVPPSLTFSWNWISDTGGGGSQNSFRYSGDTLVIDSVARIHLVTRDSSFDNGSYVFRFKARSIDFGWRLPDSVNSVVGKSLRLTYDPIAAPNRITLAKGIWQSQTADFADSLEYMYDPDLWHVVQIIDSAGTLGIYFDGIKLDFFHSRTASQYLSGLGPGGLGIGTRNSGMKFSSVLVIR
jgi:hypothetical protein